jgi:dTDP-4-dehydrorhamnose 3,5-epimerase-like enzyme
MLKVEKTKLDGVLLVKPDCFEDFRGVYVETYNEKAYNEAGIDVKFVQDDYSGRRSTSCAVCMATPRLGSSSPARSAS